MYSNYVVRLNYSFLKPQGLANGLPWTSCSAGPLIIDGMRAQPSLPPQEYLVATNHGGD